MDIRKGDYLIYRSVKNQQMVVGGIYLAGDNPEQRMRLLKELLRHAYASIGNTQYQIAIERGTGIEINVDPHGEAVTVWVADDAFTFYPIPAKPIGNHADEEEEEDEDAPLRREDAEEREEAVAAQGKIDLAAFCGCGHRGSNHDSDADGVYCRVCNDFTDECQKLVG